MIMRDIAIERILPFPRELVWSTVASSDYLAQWLMPNDFRPIAGHEFTFKTDPAPGFDGIVQCTVREIDPPRRLVLTWRGGPLDTILTIDLTDAGSGTRLALRHAGFRGVSNVIPRFILGLGWKRKTLNKLQALLQQRAGS
jgi:uncharacterized protein YndB with AHSA1/START domain